MFTKTERLLISVIIVAAVLAVLSMFLSYPASAKELPVVTLVQHEPVYHENTEVVGQMPELNLQKFSNPVPCGGGNPPVVGGTDAQSKDSFHVAPAAEGRLTKSKGVHQGPSGKETWYNLNMGVCVWMMRGLGYSEKQYPVWTRDDGAKMLGPYVMCAANLELRPKGTVIMTSLGESIVVDTGTFCQKDKTAVDLCVNW